MAKNFKSGSGGSRLWTWLGLSTIVILFDQVSKITIARSFHLGEIYPVTSFFNLRLAHNTGAAFSFLADASGWQRHFFTALGICAALFIIYLLRKHSEKPLFSCALALVLGGALGNVIDRLLYGYVIDFLEFYLPHSQLPAFPAFNIADSAITIGAGLFILDELRRVNK